MSVRLLPLLIAIQSFAAEAPRPNILYFYVDDMGWGSIGPNGQAERRAKGLPNVKTPNLDKLAAEGINFTRSYGCTVCSPSRSSQQTGFHQGHTFADRNDPDNAKKAIRADDITMGDALSAAGYTTGYWGKWGYGGTKEQEDPQIVNVQTLPTSHGYQHVLAELHHVRAHTFYQPTLWSAPAPKGSKGGLHLVPNSMAKYKDNPNYPDQPSNHNHPDYPTPAYCDDLYCFQALDFVRNGATAYNETQKPFFGILGVQIPHAPFQEIQKIPGWDSAYQDDPHFDKLSPQARQWAAMVTRIDAHFGNILAALEDPNGDGDTSDSVANNTLVIYQSDNGGPKGANNTEFDANGGLRGNKGSIYEGGIRVPTLMRWPSKIHCNGNLKPGTDHHRPIDITDLLPTFCELAGTEIPLGIDGVSLAPTLTGEGYQRPREFLIHEAGKGASIIRGKHKLIRMKKGDMELYDLDKDPGETTNLVAGSTKLVKELEEILIAERVTEPKGFAVTYHEWVGKKGSKISKAENWSEYIYQNEGIIYQAEKGTPTGAWIAKMNANGSQLSKIVKDTQFLALALHQSTAESGLNTLMVSDGAEVSCRNGIQIDAGASIVLETNGSLSSDRGIDIRDGGGLYGFGKITGHLFNSGTVGLIGSNYQISGDYVEEGSSRLRLQVSPLKEHALKVEGAAILAGKLEIETYKGVTVSSAKPTNDFKNRKVYRLVTASSISGKFSNPDDKVQAGDGTEFAISYSDKSVTLTVLGK